jgi:hypothetical protein
MSLLRFKFAAAALPLVLAGCSPSGNVEQGQVIEYRRSAGTVTLIRDSNYRDPANPRFDMLPPATVRMPSDPAEMGPEPAAGKLLAFDWGERRAVIFHSPTGTLRTVEITPLDRRGRLSAADAARLPFVDRGSRTVTAWWPRDRQAFVFTVPDEYLALPDDTWKAGDEVRYYYRDPGQALRLMNVTKTDLEGK